MFWAALSVAIVGFWIGLFISFLQTCIERKRKKVVKEMEKKAKEKKDE